MALKDFMVKQNATMMGLQTVGGYLAGPSNFIIDPTTVGDDTGTVEIKGSLNLSINVENGVQVIKQALESAEEYTTEKDQISVKCLYDGAPEYRIHLKQGKRERRFKI